MNFSNQHRNEFIQQLTSQTFDVLVIGGGITGAGIALDGTLRGLKIALIDMQDFAAGTSSRSTKLIHGGLRYLKQGEMRLVSEVGKEREIVYNNGPHVTTPMWMLLPIYKHGTFGRCTTSLGLRVYDFLASVKKSERRRMLSREECIEKVPLIKRKGLIGAGFYVEYRTDDARLTIEVIKAAHDHGALCLNYMKAVNLQYDESGKVNGALVVDQLTGRSHVITAKKIVNAAGPWVESICEKDRSLKGKTMQLTKGSHLVFDQNDFPLKQAIYFDTYDRRMVFAIPREGKTYVGTTDTFFQGDLISPKVTREDRGYLLKCINYMFPSLALTDKNIESSWAGVRPLIMEEGKDLSEISRKDEIWESETGLITIAGGKLTGYRKMAEMTVDFILGRLDHDMFKPCETVEKPVSGGEVGGVLVRALTLRNEPAPVPDSMGACIVAGYNNWDRVAGLRRQWEACNPRDASEGAWSVVFAGIVRKELYQDRFILLSSGPYSGVGAAAVGEPEEKWKKTSLTIRLEHECAHYFTRQALGAMRNAILDELIADFAGIVAATGRYRADWFLRFLGLECPSCCRPGGRIHDCRGTPPLSDGAFLVLQAVVRRAAAQLERFAATNRPTSSPVIENARAIVALACIGLKGSHQTTHRRAWRRRARAPSNLFAKPLPYSSTDSVYDYRGVSLGTGRWSERRGAHGARVCARAVGTAAPDDAVSAGIPRSWRRCTAWRASPSRTRPC